MNAGANAYFPAWAAHVEALWKRPTAADGSSMRGPSLAQRLSATGGSRRQQLLAPYTQEVARSSRAPPTPRRAVDIRTRRVTHDELFESLGRPLLSRWDVLHEIDDLRTLSPGADDVPGREDGDA